MGDRAARVVSVALCVGLVVVVIALAAWLVMALIGWVVEW